jgi:hypothetical protein
MEERIMDLMQTAQVLGNFGEFIGAFAIVVALGGVYFQVRQNNVQSRATAAIAITEGWQRTIIEMASSGPLGRAFMEVSMASDPAEVRPEALFRVVAFLSCGMKNAELCFMQYQHGAVDEEIWATARDTARSTFSTPLFRVAIWPQIRPQLSEKFGTYMSELIEQGDSASSPD